jgi:hypothetical protein
VDRGKAKGQSQRRLLHAIAFNSRIRQLGVHKHKPQTADPKVAIMVYFFFFSSITEAKE